MIRLFDLRVSTAKQKLTPQAIYSTKSLVIFTIPFTTKL